MPNKPNPPPEITRLRKRMDRINARLARQLDERARLALAIGRAKAKLGLKAADLARERAMLRTLLRDTSNVLERRDMERIWRAIFGASRRLVVRDRAR